MMDLKKKINSVTLSEQFHKAHTIGSEKFGWSWMIANRQAVRACREVGLDPTTPQMKTLLSLAALHILTNTQADKDE